MGGSAIPNAADLAPSALLASAKATLPLFRELNPALHDHLLNTLPTTDPLGITAAFQHCKRVHDTLAATIDPISNYSHKPPTALPEHARQALLAKQNYTDLTLAKNLHKMTRLKLMRTYKDDDVHTRAMISLIAQSAPIAGAWLNIPQPSTYIIAG